MVLSCCVCVVIIECGSDMMWFCFWMIGVVLVVMLFVVVFVVGYVNLVVLVGGVFDDLNCGCVFVLFGLECECECYLGLLLKWCDDLKVGMVYLCGGVFVFGSMCGYVDECLVGDGCMCVGGFWID